MVLTKREVIGRMYRRTGVQAWAVGIGARLHATEPLERRAPYCPVTDEEWAAVQAFEDEVIDRLFALNAERAAEEKRAREAAAPPAKAKGARKTAAKKSAGPGKKGRGTAKAASGVLPGFEEEGEG